MTREEILAGLSHAEASVAAWRRLLAELETGAPDSAPAPRRLLDTAAAEKRTGMSRTWLYQNARTFGFGHQLATGAWRFDPALLDAFMSGRKASRAENAASLQSVQEKDFNGVL
ncbi:hypothetical protein AMST5_00060 [freshwater sediment metagenome]|uniref:Helix-turn-helix domain-containing protein n=1 Tax=freshwater sediment metagenome TaxID=556182 RepID=A0AA48LWS8_9ZZZZ